MLLKEKGISNKNGSRINELIENRRRIIRKKRKKRKNTF